MADRLVSELARLCANRFVSLGDAVRSLLTFLEQEVGHGIAAGRAHGVDPDWLDGE